MNSETKIDFSTIMASSIHDMKNSLSIILDTAGNLSNDDTLTTTQRATVDLLHFEGERLNNAFIQLLALYRIENKQYALNIDSHNVYDSLEEAMFENETLLTHHNIEIEIDCDRALEWFFDRTMILGIVNTIINNALRYARHKIILTAATDDSGLNISIIDDGPGYPEEVINRDQKQQNGLDFQTGNTGLGLYFARVVAEMHQNGDQSGRIQLDNNRPDGGGKFSIHLP